MLDENVPQNFSSPRPDRWNADLDTNSNIRRPLLSVENREVSNANRTAEKVFRGRIRVKSDKSLGDSSNADDEASTHRTGNNPTEASNHEHCLSPESSVSIIVVYATIAFDFTFGVFLITHGVLMLQNNYGSLISSLIAGLILLCGSVAGIGSHTPLGKLCCHSDENMGHRSSVLFTTALGLISFGLYYMLALIVMSSPNAIKSWFGVCEMNVGVQCFAAFVAFIQSLGEIHRVIYLHYHNNLDHGSTEESVFVYHDTSAPLNVDSTVQLNNEEGYVVEDFRQSSPLLV